MGEQPAIGSMPLYTHVDRIARGLAARGIRPGDAIDPEQLFALDQWHYHGTEAIAAAAASWDSARPVAFSMSGRASVVRRAFWRTPRDATSRPSSCSPNSTRWAATSRAAAGSPTA